MDKPTAKKIFIPVVVVGLFLAVIVIGLFAFDLIIQPDNTKIACDKLPSAEDVQKVLTEHKDVIKELEKLSDTNSISFSIDTERCSGKADILIYYGTESQRKQIKEKIGKKFFGVPYRMFNV